MKKANHFFEMIGFWRLLPVKNSIRAGVDQQVFTGWIWLISQV
jgi:hypothetical protein